MKLTARVMRYAHGPQFAFTGPNGRIKVALMDSGAGMDSETLGHFYEALAAKINSSGFEFEFPEGTPNG